VMRPGIENTCTGQNNVGDMS